jgi:hypothetical protein
MRSRQPEWEFVANLGDKDPLDHGGIFVFKDRTSVYEAEVEVLQLTCEKEDMERYSIHRFSIDRCTYVDGILSDNKYHPKHPAWWIGSMESLASYIDEDKDALIARFCSEDVCERASAYCMLGDCFGFNNLDHYPLESLTRSEVEERYRSHPYTHSRIP